MCAGSVGCSNGGGSSDPAAPNSAQVVNGVNFDGTYIFANIQCYDSTLTTLTNSASYTTPLSDVMVISGHSVTATTTGPGCTVNDSAAVSVGATSFDLTNRKIDSATNGSCSISQTVNNPNIAPGTISTNYSTGQTLSSIFGASYLYNASAHALGLLSGYTDGHGGYCFEIFIRQ